MRSRSGFWEAKKQVSFTVSFGGFHTWRYPKSWIVWNGKSQSKLDDDEWYLYDLGNPHLALVLRKAWSNPIKVTKVYQGQWEIPLLKWSFFHGKILHKLGIFRLTPLMTVSGKSWMFKGEFPVPGKFTIGHPIGQNPPCLTSSERPDLKRSLKQSHPPLDTLSTDLMNE